MLFKWTVYSSFLATSVQKQNPSGKGMRQSCNGEAFIHWCETVPWARGVGIIHLF